MTFISLVGINFLLGVTWLFLVFFIIFDNGTTNTVFLFLSSVFVTLQGFFIFFFFIALNADARKAWKKLLCPCKKEAKPTTKTNNKHLVKGSNGEDVCTLSSDLSSCQSATLNQNTEKCSKQTQEMLPFKSLSALKEDEKGSFPDAMDPRLEYINSKISPEEESEDERKGTITLRRVCRQSSQKVSHDIEMVELDFGPSSDESLNEEDFSL